MKKYLTITVREQMQGMTVEKVLYDYLELTKKQVSRAKFRPDGICKNKVCYPDTGNCWRTPNPM